MSTRRCINDNAKSIISELYAKLLNEEMVNGFEASVKMFDLFRNDSNISDPDSFNIYMQNLNK